MLASLGRFTKTNDWVGKFLTTLFPLFMLWSGMPFKFTNF